MFDLERAISDWKKSLNATKLEDGDKYELEDHVRESITKKIENGMGPREAFDQVMHEVGAPQILASELIKSKRTPMKSNGMDFIRHLFVISRRNLIKKKFYTFINTMGLAVGLAGFFLISIYVYDEWNFDRFHKDSEQIYQLAHEVTWDDGTVDQSAWSASGWPVYLSESFPEIEEFVRFVRFSDSFLNYKKGNKIYHEDEILFTDSTFFNFFNFDLIVGDPDVVLVEPRSIVMTETTAKKYFGNENPIGEVITFTNWNSSLDLKVTGVMQDPPANTQIRPEFVANVNGLVQLWNFNLNNNLRGLWFYGYLKIKNPEKIPEYVKLIKSGLFDVMGEQSEKYNPYFIQLSESHFTPQMKWQLQATSDYDHLYTLMIIAFLIIVLAVVNFINLSTAIADKRAKEVGLRKTLGSTKYQLKFQFFMESLMTVFAALLIAVLIIHLSWSFFNDITDRQLNLWAIISNKNMLIPAVLFTVFVGLASGFYPAVHLSSFKPIEALKSQSFSTKQFTIGRIGLVVLQFTTAIALMISSYVLYEQLQLINDTSLSRDKDVTISIRTAGYNIQNDQLDRFRDRQQSINGIEGVTMGMHLPRMEHFARIDTKFDISGGSERKVKWNKFEGDGNFPNVFNLELIAGRNFNRVDEKNVVLINEAAVKSLGMSKEDVLGLNLKEDSLNRFYSRRSGQVIGVVKDFPYQTIRQKIDPLAIFSELGNDRILSVKFNSKNVIQSIAKIEADWREAFPDAPFKYWFLDQEFGKVYFLERRISRIVPIFTGLAIFIAILGLFGLTSYITEQRRKEMGIRKVLGCDTAQILILLSWNFLKLVIISVIVATPISIYFIDQWLENFAYRVGIAWWLFPAVGLLAMLMAFITISFHSFKVARTNPAEVIRHE